MWIEGGGDLAAFYPLTLREIALVMRARARAAERRAKETRARNYELAGLLGIAISGGKMPSARAFIEGGDAPETLNDVNAQTAALSALFGAMPQKGS